MNNKNELQWPWNSIDIHDLALEELPEDMREIATIIGPQATLKLMDKFGGNSIYFTKLATALGHRRNDQIKQEFSGCNHKELTRKYDVTIQHIYRLVGSSKDYNSRD